ncbi:hypothetical protein Dxin01_03510 [Deinococcus xinjiangensis]|uniref:Barstar (barnase inhibitor) domain-containing protein n=1 Tax=Deinococcus xinjiangensis TaxID=457454 RepID=A0ABP9VI35_9DEIO
MTEYSSSGPRPVQGQRIPRATQRFLGVIAPHSPADPVPGKVRIEHDAWQIILAMLEQVGIVRHGPLWGSYADALAMVTDAGHSGYRQALPLPFQGLHLDPTYILGWSDCLSNYGGNDTDWIGHWLILPDNQVADDLAVQQWLAAAAELGVFTERHFVVVVGTDAEQVRGRAYLYQQRKATEIALSVV